MANDPEMQKKSPLDFDPLAMEIEKALENVNVLEVRGRITEILGTIIKARVPHIKVGELCRLVNPDDGQTVLAEVVGFCQQDAILTPLGSSRGLSNKSEVLPTGNVLRVDVGDGMLGTVLDGAGRIVHGKGPRRVTESREVYAECPNPMKRQLIREPISLGVRALDGLLTLGEGQRVGIFAAAGVGKSTLMAKIIRSSEADVAVIALIGERGREVREFIEDSLGEEGMAKTVVVVATSDRPSMERVQAAYLATTIAEYYRDQGKKVLLLMDSLTRFARAQREIGLSAGEPPTRRGYPPSVFSELPRLLERTGMSDKGSITALYTVLVEGDDMNEPVADESRSLLDGHIILSRKMAESGHFPAIDILGSVSRLFTTVATPEQQAAAYKIRELMAKFNDVELLVNIGEYKTGSDKVADEAIRKIDHIRRFLRQAMHEKSSLNEAISMMLELAK